MQRNRTTLHGDAGQADSHATFTLVGQPRGPKGVSRSVPSLNQVPSFRPFTCRSFSFYKTRLDQSRCSNPPKALTSLPELDPIKYVL